MEAVILTHQVLAARLTVRLSESLAVNKSFSVPTTTSPNLFPVDGVVHRNIGSDFFVHLFVSLLVNKILSNFVRMRVKNCRSFTQFCKELLFCFVVAFYCYHGYCTSQGGDLAQLAPTSKGLA